MPITELVRDQPAPAPRPSSGSTGSSSDGLTPEQKALREALGLDDNFGTEEDEFTEDFFWQDAVIDRIFEDIKSVSKAYDMDLDYMEGWFNGQKLNLVNYLTKVIAPQTGDTANDHFWTQTPGGIQRLFDVARSWVGLQIPGFEDAVNGSGSISSSSGRSGSGSSKPTAAQIRAKFDLDELTRAVNDMSRGLVLSDEKNARSIAKAYVNTIVSNPEQQVDFETYVRNRILSGDRAKVIYKNKPKSLSEEQYLQPYVQAAQSRIGPGFGNQLADVSIAGAQLNSDPEAFDARLQRTPQVQASAPFLQKLGKQISSLKGVLR